MQNNVSIEQLKIGGDTMDEEKIIQEANLHDQSIPPTPPDAEPKGEISERAPADREITGDIPREDHPDDLPTPDAPLPGEVPSGRPAESDHDPLVCPAPTPGDAAQSECTQLNLLPELRQIESAVTEISAATQRSAVEIREMHRLYHNEFASRLKSMQDELDQYHNVDRGKTFDGILSAIARIYSNNETLVDEIEDPKVRKHVRYMLLDLSDLLEEYGVLKLKSEVGDKRNTRHCQIVERIPTEAPALHDTIAASHNTGFHKDNRTIIKELVDVYFHDKTSSPREEPIDIQSEEGSNN